MRFIRRLFRAFKEAAFNYFYDPIADLPDYWTEEDAAHLLEFQLSSTGRKLRSRLMNYMMSCALEATSRADLHHNGIAHGIRLAIYAIDRHLPASPVRNTDNSEEQPNDAEAELALR